MRREGESFGAAPGAAASLTAGGGALAMALALLMIVGAGAVTAACAAGGAASSGVPATPTPLASAAPAATPRPPVPAARVPDQPYVGTPRPIEQPYLEIMRLKNRGATNEELLAKVQGENVVYTLSTYDIQRLRASGISQEVIAAMLSSGREGRTPTSSSASTPTPTPRGS